eukprot:TRINITY_DN2058_c1_g2_i1.p1 TRINITY_DN2058_c1_g2~~TRINITY_DN2058_c1_g2_i1.p1  ORF type:complete len:492 (+),score=80.62 TRINITY_DN2058_c1_g2_i1:47-1477(+)
MGRLSASERARNNSRRVSNFDKMLDWEADPEKAAHILKHKLRHHKPPFSIPLDRDTFKRLWKAVHPVNAKGAKDWMLVDQQYDIIDVDNDENVTVEEMLKHLSQLEPLTRERSIDPKSWTQWLGAFVGVGPPPNNEVIAYRIFSAVIVLVSIVNLMAETLPEYYNHSDNHFGTDFTFVIDIFCNIWFTLELIAWLVSYEDPDGKKYRVLLTFETWIDITSIIPFYLELILRSAAESSRPLQILRFWRIIRSISIATRVSQRKVGRGTIGGKVHRFVVSWCWLSLVLLPAVVCSASFIFFIERNQATFNTTSAIWFRNPDSSYDDAGLPLLYQSVNDAVWWSLVTLTTVGYGDLFPVTPVGKLIGAMTMLFGIIVLAYPIAIIASVDDEAAEEEVALRQSVMFYQGIRNWVDSSAEENTILSPRGSSGQIVTKSFPRWAQQLSNSIEDELKAMGESLDNVDERINNFGKDAKPEQTS